MSNYAELSHILNEFQLNLKRPISSQYQEIDDQIKMGVCGGAADFFFTSFRFISFL